MGLLSPVDSTDERRALRASVHQLATAELPPHRALEIDAERLWDEPLWQSLARLGLLGLGGDEALGGTGGSATDSMIATEELSRALPSLGVVYVGTAMAMRTLSDPACGPMSRLLAPVASGELKTTFAMSEPGGGTDLLRLRTTAREVEGEWRLNGQKTWITLGTEADVLLVVARTDPPEGDRLSRGISVIAVPTDQPGVERRRVKLAGMRAAVTTEIFFDDARAPLENVVGERGRAMSILGRTLDVERLLSGAISLGIAAQALELSVRYAGERNAFERPIGAFQAVQHPIADSAAEVFALRAAMDRVAASIDAGEESRNSAAMVKMYAGEVAARVVDRAMRAHGAMGLAEEGPLQMFFRDARLALFSPMSNEMAKNTIGEALGLPRSY
ncbi:MAG TPA: acyl-CoA dehydrogenase family protein [Marmoricola sp.]|jgi:alkylation response protein AidB-like acyl-CoA dehydrogenase|nr:acyl-CoA dehydrogenase family protein [Marmoricola sp.]